MHAVNRRRAHFFFIGWGGVRSACLSFDVHLNARGGDRQIHSSRVGLKEHVHIVLVCHCCRAVASSERYTDPARIVIAVEISQILQVLNPVHGGTTGDSNFA